MTNKGASARADRSTLEAIEFLARSTNRVQVLESLVRGPTDRGDIEATTGFSRATLSRTLNQFEERGWVLRDGHRYELTELGEFVAHEFMRLLDRMRVVPSLRDVIGWFPEDGYGFDLALLSDADIVRPSKEDALAPTNNLVARLESGSRVRVLSYSVLPVVLETCWRKATEGSQELELVVEPAVLDTVRQNRMMASRLADLLAADSVRIFRYDGDLPYVVVIADEVVNLCLSDEDGAPHAMIDTENETIREWAEASIDSFRSEAVPVDSKTLVS